MKQPVRVEGVVDATAFAHLEMESELLTTRADRLATSRVLLRRGAVLLLEVFSDVLTRRTQLWVELKRLKMHVHQNVIAQSAQGCLERFQPDDAPGTRNVGNEIDLDVLAHEQPA